MPVLIGLSNVHYAILTKDDATGVAYGKPKRIYGAVSASKNPNPSTDTLYADDGPNESATTLGQIELGLTMKDLPLEQQSEILGHEIKEGRLIRKSTDTPPYIAVGYSRMLNDGTYRHKWLYKGKAAEISEEAETKGDSINYQTPEISISFVHRDYDQRWECESDATVPGASGDMLKKWFESVEPGVIYPTDFKLTTTPVDGASVNVGDLASVSWNSTVTLDVSTVTQQSVMITSATKGAVAGAIDTSVDKVIKFTPTVPFIADSYTMIATNKIKDSTGRVLPTTSVTSFTVK